MKLSIFHCAVGVLAAVAMTSGCRCGPPPTTKTQAEFTATPAALQFNACPTKDENGNAVADVFPDEQVLTISNIGKVAGNVASLEITGGDPDIKTIFTIPADKKPGSIAGSESVDVPVRFSPNKRGDITGTLTIDDGLDDTDPVVVSLLGAGSTRPAQPTVGLSFETAPASGQYDECDPSVLNTCSPNFPPTFFGESTRLRFKVKNSGCPTLKITNVEIKSSLLQTASQQAFTFENGFVVPSSTSPANLNAADENSELAFDVVFSPVNETTNPSQPDDGQRYAVLSITTNDPQYPTLDVALAASGSAPSAYVSPGFCNFTDANDPCGNSPKVTGKAKVTIGNGGQFPIKVKDIKFTFGGRSGRFSLSGTSAIGATIAAGSTVSQEVSYQDQPIFVSDELVVSTTDAVDTTKSAGDVKVTFYGGNLPCLTTEPGDTLSFENPTADLTVKDVVIKNGAAPCGTLIVDDVAVDQPNPFFSVVDPKLAPGTQVAAGSSVTAKIQFKKPVAGGTQTGVLRVKTNDPAYGPEPYKVITMYSDAPLNQVPVAVIKGPAGQTGTMSISKATIPVSNGKKNIQVVGTDSYDPTPTGTKPVSQYLFVILAKPASATNFSISNAANPNEKCTAVGCQLKITNDKALLAIDDASTGEYRIALQVFDDTNQKSSNIDTLKIQVNP